MKKRMQELNRCVGKFLSTKHYWVDEHKSELRIFTKVFLYSEEVEVSAMLEAMREREACPLLNNPGVQENFFKKSFYQVQAAYGEYMQMQKRLQDTEHQLQNVLAWAHARSDTDATEQAEVAIHELKTETDALKKELDEQNMLIKQLKEENSVESEKVADEFKKQLEVAEAQIRELESQHLSEMREKEKEFQEKLEIAKKV